MWGMGARSVSHSEIIMVAAAFMKRFLCAGLCPSLLCLIQQPGRNGSWGWGWRKRLMLITRGASGSWEHLQPLPPPPGCYLQRETEATSGPKGRVLSTLPSICISLYPGGLGSGEGGESPAGPRRPGHCLFWVSSSVTWEGVFWPSQAGGAQGFRHLGEGGGGNGTPSLAIAASWGEAALPGPLSAQSLFLQPQQREDDLGHGRGQSNQQHTGLGWGGGGCSRQGRQQGQPPTPGLGFLPVTPQPTQQAPPNRPLPCVL